MSKTTILFHAEDKSVPSLILECEYTIWKGNPKTWVSPAEPDGVEVSEVRCVGIDVDGEMDLGDVSEIIGALAWQADHKQIEDKVMEAASE